MTKLPVTRWNKTQTNTGGTYIFHRYKIYLTALWIKHRKEIG